MGSLPAGAVTKRLAVQTTVRKGDAFVPAAVGYASRMATERLAEYERRRNFDVSAEPRACAPHDGVETEAPVFVIQRHEASSTHFDVRLEVEGVLVSWAVPKGPSTDPRDKRLAMRTEDHPLEYAEFEGTIPAGEYGAGTVIVWDTGTYTHQTKRHGRAISAAEAVHHGHLTVCLDGAKLAGGYVLTRTRGHDGADREAWLLVKLDDAGADRRRRPVRTEPRSVLSGRTNADLAGEQGG